MPSADRSRRPSPRWSRTGGCTRPRTGPACDGHRRSARIAVAERSSRWDRPCAAPMQIAFFAVPGGPCSSLLLPAEPRHDGSSLFHVNSSTSAAAGCTSRVPRTLVLVVPAVGMDGRAHRNPVAGCGLSGLLSRPAAADCTPRPALARMPAHPTCSTCKLPAEHGPRSVNRLGIGDRDRRAMGDHRIGMCGGLSR